MEHSDRTLCSNCQQNRRQKGQRWCRPCRSENAAKNRKTLPKTEKLDVLVPDPNNANRGNKRGRKMLHSSLSELGAGRSILVDKNNVIIAGNQTFEQAGITGIKNVRIIESDGTELIAVRRTDLDLKTDAVAKRLAVADNRVGEVSLDWDKDILAGLSAEVNLAPFFESLSAPLKDLSEDAPVKYKYAVVIECPTAEDQDRIYHRLAGEGVSCRRETKK